MLNQLKPLDFKLNSDFLASLKFIFKILLEMSGKFSFELINSFFKLFQHEINICFSSVVAHYSDSPDLGKHKSNPMNHMI